MISVDDITLPAVIRGFTFLQNIRVSAEIPVILIFPPDERAFRISHSLSCPQNGGNPRKTD